MIIALLSGAQKVTPPTVQPRHHWGVHEDWLQARRIQTGLREEEEQGAQPGAHWWRLELGWEGRWIKGITDSAPGWSGSDPLISVRTDCSRSWHGTTATTTETRRWIVNDKCKEKVFYVCQHCQWFLIMWRESLQVFVPTSNQTLQQLIPLMIAPTVQTVRGTNQENRLL